MFFLSAHNAALPLSHFKTLLYSLSSSRCRSQNHIQPKGYTPRCCEGSR